MHALINQQSSPAAYADRLLDELDNRRLIQESVDSEDRNIVVMKEERREESWFETILDTALDISLS